MKQQFKGSERMGADMRDGADLRREEGGKRTGQVQEEIRGEEGGNKLLRRHSS